MYETFRHRHDDNDLPSQGILTRQRPDREYTLIQAHIRYGNELTQAELHTIGSRPIDPGQGERRAVEV